MTPFVPRCSLQFKYTECMNEVRSDVILTPIYLYDMHHEDIAS